MSLQRAIVFARTSLVGAAAIGGIVLAVALLGPLTARADTTGGGAGGFGLGGYDVATIPAGTSSVTITPRFGQLFASSGSSPICTLQSDPGGRSLKYAAMIGTNGQYTVHLDGKAKVDITVACILVGIAGPISGPISGPVSGPVSGPISGSVSSASH